MVIWTLLHQYLYFQSFLHCTCYILKLVIVLVNSDGATPCTKNVGTFTFHVITLMVKELQKCTTPPPPPGSLFSPPLPKQKSENIGKKMRSTLIIYDRYSNTR